MICLGRPSLNFKGCLQQTFLRLFLNTLIGIECKASGEVFLLISFLYHYYPFKRQPHKLVKHTQTICRQITDKLLECVCLIILWGWSLKSYICWKRKVGTVFLTLLHKALKNYRRLTEIQVITIIYVTCEDYVVITSPTLPLQSGSKEYHHYVTIAHDYTPHNYQ